MLRLLFLHCKISLYRCTYRPAVYSIGYTGKEEPFFFFFHSIYLRFFFPLASFLPSSSAKQECQDWGSQVRKEKMKHHHHHHLRAPVMLLLVLLLLAGRARCDNEQEGEEQVEDDLALDLEMAEHLASLPFECYNKVHIYCRRHFNAGAGKKIFFFWPENLRNSERSCAKSLLMYANLIWPILRLFCEFCDFFFRILRGNSSLEPTSRRGRTGTAATPSPPRPPCAPRATSTRSSTGASTGTRPCTGTGSWPGPPTSSRGPTWPTRWRTSSTGSSRSGRPCRS